MAGVRSKDHDEKRQSILRVAAELFGRQGFNKTSIAQIGTACKASKAWIYHYFPAKEDVLFALLFDFLGKVNERIEAALQSPEAPELRLHAFVRECVQIYADYRINYPVLFNEMIFLRQDQQRVLRDLEAYSVRSLDAILVELRPELADARAVRTPVTLLVFGTINWTYTWFNPDGKMSLEALARLIVGFVLNGVGSMTLKAHVEAKE